MRLICEFEFDGVLTLPIHYNHIIQGFIYNNLTDNALRTFLHEVGFKTGNRSYKLFTYSRILGKFQIDKKNKTISFESPIKIHISTLVDDFMDDLCTTIFKSNRLYLGNKDVELSSIHGQDPKFQEEKIRVKTLSPIVIYSTVKVDGKQRTVYYNPKDSLFSEKIRENLLRKYRAIHGQAPEDDRFEIKYIDNNKEPKISVINYHKTIIKGYNGKFMLKGNPELIRLGYFTGIGSKNSQGFGCFEIIN